MIKERLTTEDLQEMFDKSKRTIYNWRKEGMPSHKDKNLVYFYKEEVGEWLKQKSLKEIEFNEAVQKCRVVTMEATMILSAFNNTANKMKEVELLKRSGVNIPEDIEEEYQLEKQKLNDILRSTPEILGYNDRMEELLFIIKIIVNQRPLQKDLLKKYSNELTDILNDLKGSK